MSPRHSGGIPLRWPIAGGTGLVRGSAGRDLVGELFDFNLAFTEQVDSSGQGLRFSPLHELVS
jgi:hypothetical protein